MEGRGCTILRVEADGPVPCDLAVVGESPGRKELELGRGWVGPAGRILWGGDDLIPTLLGRARETVYASNVCKVPLPDREWEKLKRYEQETFYKEIREELQAVQPKVVLAMGRRACIALIPDFYSITREHGKPVWGYGELYIVQPCWHPAAYLRGNKNVLADLIVDISQVPALLEDGLPKPLKDGPALPWKATDECLQAWPAKISFMVRGKLVKLKCTLCGSKQECGRYAGKGLKWILCMKHAILTEKWAAKNENVLLEHATAAVDDTKKTRFERAAIRMEKRMRQRWTDRSTDETISIPRE